MLEKQLAFIGGWLVGATGMYLLDPHRGNYRRAVVRDKTRHFRKVLRKKAVVIGRDLGHRSMGVVAEMRGRLFPKEIPDDVLVARVASTVGRVVANPHAIELTADDGCVFVGGPVFVDEVTPLIRAIEAIPGVCGVENGLEPHRRDEEHPALQGHRHLKGPKLDLFQTKWSPATRFLVGLGGGLLALATGLEVQKSVKKPAA